jgi:hypothetical protein
MLQIPMLKNHLGFADWNTLAAIGAFFLYNDIGTVVATVYSVLRAGLGAFAALNTNFGFICTRFREMSLDAQRRLSGVDILKILDGADLHAETATCTILRLHLEPLYFICFGFHNQDL